MTRLGNGGDMGGEEGRKGDRVSRMTTRFWPE